MKRTQDELEATVNIINRLRSTDDWKIFEIELRKIKDAVASGAYREKGEDLAKSAGVLHGIDIALTLSDMLKASIRR